MCIRDRISACEKARQVDRAFEVYEAMRQAGVQPDVITFNALISACASSPSVRRRPGKRHLKNLPLQRALAVYTHMVALGVQPDVITLKALMNICEKSKGVDSIFLILSQVDLACMPSVRHRLVEVPATEVLGSVCRALASGQKRHRALLHLTRYHVMQAVFS